MARLGSISPVRHGVVGASVLMAGGLVLGGVIGSDDSTSLPERFDAKQVLIQPAGESGVRIREVVDQDFGTADRHGYQRLIPNDFGVPTDVTASSPDAPDDVSVEEIGLETRIRIGSPSETVTGQHRYVLTYTLPDARLTSDQLFLDVIGTDETFETDRFEIVVTGMTLDDPACSVGALGTDGGCALEPDGDTYRAVVAPLSAGDGITISGTITDRFPPAGVPEPAIPARRETPNRVPLAALMLPLGAASAGGVVALARRRGRNEVYAGGAADAAYGETTLPPPGGPPLPTRLVPDSRMDEMVTTEFVPPKGLQPWQGNVLVRETIDNDTVSAWFSGLAARDVLTIAKEGKSVTLRRGPAFDQVDATENAVLHRLFDGRGSIQLNQYEERFATAWRDARASMVGPISTSGWWKRRAPAGVSKIGGADGLRFLFIGASWAIIVVALGTRDGSLLGPLSGPVGAISFGVIAPALTAFLAYRSLLPVRSAQGSALALRTESFRRFLAASEGRHVEWAWSKGLLREYSAWAVALGAADTWQRAMEASSVPPTEITSGPLIVWSHSSDFTASHTPPSSSGGGSGGGGGGGGFSGGVGGGGGGGSSGSW